MSDKGIYFIKLIFSASLFFAMAGNYFVAWAEGPSPAANIEPHRIQAVRAEADPCGSLKQCGAIRFGGHNA